MAFRLMVFAEAVKQEETQNQEKKKREEKEVIERVFLMGQKAKAKGKQGDEEKAPEKEERISESLSEHKDQIAR